MKEAIEILCVNSFSAQGTASEAKPENRGYGAPAENHVSSVSLCAACVCALIKERRGSKRVKAILSNCFHTPVHILPQRKLDIDATVEQKQCLSNQADLPNLTEQSQHKLTRQSRKEPCKKSVSSRCCCVL